MRRLLRYPVALVAVAAVYWAAAALSLRVALVNDVVTPVWPPTGIALVALLVLGRRVWPGIALGAFLVNLPPRTPSVAAAAVITLGNTLAPVVAAELLRWLRFRRALDRLRDALAIVAVGIVSMAVSATVGTTTLWLAGAIQRSALLETWSVWWAGDATGVLVFAPLLLSFTGARRDEARLPASRVVEAAVLALGLAGVSSFAFSQTPPMPFLVFPFLVWAAVRFGLRGGSVATLVAAGFAIRAAVEDLGPFAGLHLAGKMLSLQAFDAAAALTSLVLAAAVAERGRSAQALRQAAEELEQRVEDRTAALLQANERLVGEVEARQRAQEEAENKERQLANAERLAQTGSWEWDMQTRQVRWSDQMYRIYGHEPQSFPVLYDGGATRQTVPADQERITRDLAARLKDPTAEHPPFEYRILRPDGEERLLLGKGTVVLGADGKPARMVGSIQDITEARRAERVLEETAERERALRLQQEIAQTLQSSLLPDRLPDVPGLKLAARYVPGSAGLEVGGDWYDVFPLPGGAVALAIGDIVGRGLQAAATMGQLRTALRAYALEGLSPAATLERLGGLAQTLPEAEMATLIYAVYQPDAGVLSFVSAGHPPPLLVRSDGSTDFLEEGRSSPLGVTGYPAGEAMLALEPGSILLLYTDGLVERRGRLLDEGLAALARAAAGRAEDAPEAVCDAVMEVMAGDGRPHDDVALMVLSLALRHAERFRFAAAAEPQHLAPLRRALSRWLSEAGATKEETDDIVLAISEAAANAVLHAYGPEDGTFEVAARVAGGVVDATVRDRGRWRSRGPDQGGRGIRLMRALVDSADIVSGPSGTEVKLCRRLGWPLGALPPGMELAAPTAAEWHERGDEGVAVVRVTEEMDFSNAEPMGAELARAVSSEHLGLVVDLSEVTLLDSSGLRLLFRLGRRLERRRQQLRVVVPLTSPVRRVLDIAAVWTGSHVTRSVEEAVVSIRDHTSR